MNIRSDITLNRERLAHHINRVVDGTLERERIVGCVIAIACDGDVVYRRAAGHADRARALPMQESAIFRLASLTKPIISATALAMVERNLLRLDDPLTNWIPEFRPRFEGREPVISIRHLMTHTSGLSYGFSPYEPSYKELNVSNGLDQPGLSIEEALGRLASTPLLFEPGSAWNYSLSTDVLGEVLARAGRASLPELVARFVTGPLGMVDTAFHVADRRRLTTAYADGMPRPEPMTDPCDVSSSTGIVQFSPSRILDQKSYASGGAGMAGTASDFLALLEVIRCGGAPILCDESAKALTTRALPPQVHLPELGWTFSLGVAVLENPKISRTPHCAGTWRWGGAYGHDWFVDPGRNLTAVTLTNTALEGDDGAFPKVLRDAIYYSMTS